MIAVRVPLVGMDNRLLGHGIGMAVVLGAVFALPVAVAFAVKIVVVDGRAVMAMVDIVTAVLGGKAACDSQCTEVCRKTHAD